MSKRSKGKIGDKLVFKENVLKHFCKTYKNLSRIRAYLRDMEDYGNTDLALNICIHTIEAGDGGDYHTLTNPYIGRLFYHGLSKFIPYEEEV